ncbi:hypothetical protein C8F04DRAFT_1231394 [Mycena alexandri]|uniref:Uncharacterized protein n=1 Tax=Mycena alexandri TaxID=1745969 RepID=A0AAD6X8S0_9AGAR|nr:hypothetical protein C8F04DRAFT_1231394 [Mycena alexandri]
MKGASSGVPLGAARALSVFSALYRAGPPEDFHDRTESDRFAPGTKPHLIQNARLWTGRKNGTEIFSGDILIDKGLIKGVGHFGSAKLQKTYGSELVVIDAWITPGIGASGRNSLKGTIQPWLRSLDAVHTNDASYALSIAGGVTTALILPGSANAIGGQAFVIKLRRTVERSSTSMVLEPPYTVNSSFPDLIRPPRWRHMKHACGETPNTIYAFRDAYNTASQIKKQQDEYCSKALANEWEGLGEFPDNRQWEALVDVLRGRVKVEAHSADIIATLILLKKEVEHAKRQTIQLTITGAAEAHLLARELGEAGVGVILNPARSFPYRWEDRRGLPGPPLTADTPISTFLAHNVTVGVGVLENWDARNVRFEIAWASYAAGGNMTQAEVLALGSTNVAKLLGAKSAHKFTPDLAATRGGDLLSFNSKVVGVISAEKGLKTCSVSPPDDLCMKMRSAKPRQTVCSANGISSSSEASRIVHPRSSWQSR